MENTQSIMKNTTEMSNEVDDNEIQEAVTSASIEPPQTHHNKRIKTHPIATADKFVQINLKMHHRSKAVQTMTVTKDVSLSPCKISTSSKYTSPFKITPCNTKSSKASVTNNNKKIVLLDEEKSDSDVSYFAPPSSIISDSETGTTDINVDIEKIQALKNTLNLIGQKLFYMLVYQKIVTF